MSKFILGVDLDGVVANYTAAMRKVLLDDKSHTIPDPTHWDLHLSPGWPLRDREHYLAVHKQAVQFGLFSSMEPYEGAALKLNQLRGDGFHIRIITHRLMDDRAYDLAAAIDTPYWLHRWGIHYDDLCFVSNKTHVESDLLIDDSPSHLAAHFSAGKSFIVYHHLYNAHVAGPRAYNWDDVYALAHEFRDLHFLRESN